MWQKEQSCFRYKNISLINGVLKGEPLIINGNLAVLIPFDYPDIPLEFANVKDTKTAINFETKYAPLAYDLLVKNKAEIKNGDPLKWVLYHARYVRLALDLIYCYRDNDAKAVPGLLDEYTHTTKKLTGIKVTTPNGSLPSWSYLIYPAGAYFKARVFPMLLYDTLSAVTTIIAALVNENTRNIRLEFKLSEFIWERTYTSLIEAIWAMLGDLAIKAMRGEGYLRRCDYCGLPFIADDKRQRFCPSANGKSKSLCGLKYRQAKFQSKDKG